MSGKGTVFGRLGGVGPSGKPHLLAFLAGLFAILLGAAVMFGWHTGNMALLQINPAFVPMQYNTALGFALGGLGLVFLVFGRPVAAGLLGAFIAVLGLLTLAEYVWGADLGIDELFIRAYIIIKTSHPGRMAPISALCFSLFGLGLMSTSLTKFRAWPRPAGEFLGVLVAVIGTTALLGYLLGREQFFTWADMTRMAAHTSAGFIVLALGFLAITLGQRKEKVAAVPVFVPGLLMVGAMVFDISQPLGIAAGIAYLPLVFSGLWFREENAPFMLAAIATLLTLLGFFYSADLGRDMQNVITNRSLSVLAFWVTAIVISVHKRTQAKLSQQAKFQDTVFNGMGDGLAVIDEKGTLLLVNSAMERIFGFTRGEMVGQNVMMFMKGKDKKAHERGLKNYLKTGEAKIIGIGAEVIGYNKKGQRLNIDISIAEEFLESQRVFVGNLRDLTERKQTERRHLKELETINEALERSNADLEQFAYVASHDLRAPLRAIDNLSQWIEEDLEEQLEGETRENMNLLRSRVKRLEKLLDDILDYSRAGRLEGKIIEVDSHKLAKEMIGLLDIPEGFKVKIEGRLPKIKAPEGVFEQIFTNLINNALSHHDKKRGKITLSATNSGRFIEFAVADDGPGIPEEYRDRIFGMFQKLQSRDKKEGSGMGLAIVRKLVRTRGGNIKLEETTAKRGATFRFTWPKKPPRESILPTVKGD